MKKFAPFLFFAVIVMGLFSCKQNKTVKTIKLAHGLDVKHSVHLAMLQMAIELKKESNGKLILEIYPNQQLGTERECLELLQIGSLDMTKVSAGVMENFAPKMKVLGLPFLFKDRQHAFAVLDSEIGQELLDDGEQYWLKGMAFYDAGSRSFYTKDKQVKSPKDLEGLKIRVMESVTAMNMVSSLGGSPTPISWGELYTSLQQGVVDGAENNPPSFYLSKHYEVCKFYTLDEHTVLPDVLVAGTQLWNRLTKKEQKWLKTAVDKSVIVQRKLWAIAEKEALDEVQKAGVTILRPSKKAFSDLVSPMYDEYKDQPEIFEIITKIQQLN